MDCNCGRNLFVEENSTQVQFEERIFTLEPGSSLPLLLKSVTLYSWLWENHMIRLMQIGSGSCPVSIVIMRIKRVGLWDPHWAETH